MTDTVHLRIAAAVQVLVRAGIAPEKAAADADVLARHSLGWDRAALFTHGREPPPPGFDAAFERTIARRVAREPVALITGHREFWGLDFEVTPDVLIPRPETELIVESTIRLARDRLPIRRIVDVGTGSGCIAVSLAREFVDARLIGTDCSGAALAVARRNSRKHGVADRILFVRSDLLRGIRGPVDVIVSNPPYVARAAARSLPPEVTRYEPPAALFAGEDGLDALRVLLGTAAECLTAAGAFVVEFGFDQAERVNALALQHGWRRISFANDLQGIPRVAVMMR